MREKYLEQFVAHLHAGLPVLVAHGPAHDVVEDDCGGVSGEAGEEAGPGGAPADAGHGALRLQAHDRLLEVTRVPDVHLRSELSTSLREVSLIGTFPC